MKNDIISYGCGCFTNGDFKMEIRIKHFKNDLQYEYLERHDHIEVKGIIKYTSN